jgi:internalin A
MPSNPDGLAIALARIAAEKSARTGFLDLGMLGLSELPTELFELEHLTGLNLGAFWRDENEKWHEAESSAGHNQLDGALDRLPHLCRLKSFWLREIKLSNLAPLRDLTELRTLDCYGTQVTSLEPLRELHSLQYLNCSSTPVANLDPLRGLHALQNLDSSGTRVANLEPLRGLHALQCLNCSGTPVANLDPLSGLNALQSLICVGTQVADLEPLSGLNALQNLNCSFTKVTEISESLFSCPSLQKLVIYKTCITDIPAEVLSKSHDDNCLQSLRAHLLDLEAGEERLSDVKILVLGNGRIGKTQICRQLRGEEFEEDADSTHGIVVTTASLPLPRDGRRDPAWPKEARLHLWDFGGQDLYHGTHALFMSTRAVFLIVWTTRSENDEGYTHNNTTSHNFMLPYWLESIRHSGGKASPMVVVQNWCDEARDKTVIPPAESRMLEAFPYWQTVHYSAKFNQGRGALDDALAQAIAWLWENTGVARIGKGRMNVKWELERLRDQDAELPPEQRKHRTLSKADFQSLCDKAGGVSDSNLLLDYLHESGIVFYRKGLFGDQIVLDQAWALDAVYTVFHREKCYRHLVDSKGRFKRTLLDALVWGKYSSEEQELFLSFMQSCGICFVHREGCEKHGTETEYIAPDLLPSRDTMSAEIDARWAHLESGERVNFGLQFLPPSVMRGILSQIGNNAGFSAVYWKYGVCLYETTTRSHALIEQHVDPTPHTYGGRITVETRGGQAADLLARFEQSISRVIRYCGCTGWTMDRETDGPRRTPFATKGELSRPLEDGPGESAIPPERKLEFAPPPSPPGTIQYYVSYSHNHKSNNFVDGLCAAAELKNIKVGRDTKDLPPGDSIIKFMDRIGTGDRVFVILSDKYLISYFCMYELLQVWRNSKMKPDEFRKHIRAFGLCDGVKLDQDDRARIVEHWKNEFAKMDVRLNKSGANVFGRHSISEYFNTKEIADHVADILYLINDLLQSQTFEEFLEFGFKDS